MMIVANIWQKKTKRGPKKEKLNKKKGKKKKRLWKPKKRNKKTRIAKKVGGENCVRVVILK